MSFPRLVRAALDQVGSQGLPGRTADEVSCEGARHHSPTPLLVKEVRLSPSGGGSAAWLCGTCEHNLSVLQHLLREHDGDLPWPVRREFGNMIRALAEKGWREGPVGEPTAQPETATVRAAHHVAQVARLDSFSGTHAGGDQ